MKNYNAILFSGAIVIAAILLGNAYLKRAQTNDVISVTGLGTKDFTSDLIVWEGTFTRENLNLQNAYTDLNRDKDLVRQYLSSKDIDLNNVVFNSVNMQEKIRPRYDEGRYVGEEFEGYILSQSIQIESKEVEKIERLSREITELLNQGVQFYSYAPRYYYTQLADLKIEMIAKATEDAYIRAKQIAENAGGSLGKLKVARMGVFQITGQNSNEDYSWGGVYNTESKQKTASITMRLEYKIR
jgi:hypothetical protein